MKKLRSILMIGALALLAGPLLAESTFEREMNLLKDQHAKAMAAATEPLLQRYKTSLEQLLKRATQANDLDAAIKIREQIAALAADAAAPTDTGKQKNTVEGLQRLLLSGEWSWASKKSEIESAPVKITFTKDGKMLMLGKPMGSYKVTGPTTVQLDHGVLKFSDDYDSFEVPKWSDGTPRYGERRK